MLITPAFENVLFELFKIITEIAKINQDPFGMNLGVILKSKKSLDKIKSHNTRGNQFYYHPEHDSHKDAPTCL